MHGLTIFHLLFLTGVINAFFLALITSFLPKFEGNMARPRLVLFLISFGTLLLIFTLFDAGLLKPLPRTIEIYDFLALTAPALFLDYLFCNLSAKPVSKAAYLPPAIYLGLTLVLGPRLIEIYQVGHIILIQMIYTATGAWLFFKWRQTASQKRQKKAGFVLLLLASLVFLHFAQVFRLVFPDFPFAFDLVPSAGLLVLFVFMTLSLLRPGGSETFGLFLPQLDKSADDNNFGKRLEKAVLKNGAYLNPDFDLESLSLATGIKKRQISLYLNEVKGEGFYEYLNGFRLEKAKQFLRDEGESRTSIEAIALMSGFRSRSVFYDYFQKVTGLTPSQFRAQDSKN